MRNVRVQVRCTAIERHEWRALAERMGLPLSDYIRVLVAEKRLQETAGEAPATSKQESQ